MTVAPLTLLLSYLICFIYLFSHKANLIALVVLTASMMLMWLSLKVTDYPLKEVCISIFLPSDTGLWGEEVWPSALGGALGSITYFIISIYSKINLWIKN